MPIDLKPSLPISHLYLPNTPLPSTVTSSAYGNGDSLMTFSTSFMPAPAPVIPAPSSPLHYPPTLTSSAYRNVDSLMTSFTSLMLVI